MMAMGEVVTREGFRKVQIGFRKGSEMVQGSEVQRRFMRFGETSHPEPILHLL
jgi:hypothetical protein